MAASSVSGASPGGGIGRGLLYWLPLAGLVAIWAAHFWWSVTLRPDAMVLDDWSAFRIPGYSREFSLSAVFGTQNDTIAAYQNLVQYVLLVATDLDFRVYIAVQNVFLLGFVLAAWLVLAPGGAAGGGAARIRPPLVALLVVPAFTGTHLFLYQAMTFNHQMPMVYMALAVLALRAERLGAARQPVAGCLLFLSGAAYLTGWMYLLAATLALALVRLLAPPAAGGGRGGGLPSWGAIACAWIALLAVAALSVWLTDRSFALLAEGTNRRGQPLLWPWDGRFWTFLTIIVARGWGLPPAPGWGGAALLATVAPLLALAFRLPRGTRRDAAEAFALAAPVLGALFALAMITAGRGLGADGDPATVAAHARGHPKYLQHATFAIPFVAAAWFRVVAGAAALSPARRTWATAAVAAACLAGFAAGANGSLAARLDFRSIYEKGGAVLRDGAICIENAVRLARATGPGVPVRCPAVSPLPDLRLPIERAERAGVASIAGIADRPPVSMEGARAAIAAAEAAGAPPAGRIDAFEAGPSWLRLAGRVAAPGEGALPGWIAVSVPGRPPWPARVGGTGTYWEAGPPDAFDATVPAGPAARPGAARVWALDVGPGGGVAAAVPLAAAPVALLDAPLAGAAPGGWIDRANWDADSRTLAISGWALADSGDDGRRLHLHAPGAVSVARFETVARPDVVAARGGDARLLHSGFAAVLAFPEGAARPPFARAWSEDRAFGRRALQGLAEPAPAPGGGE